MSGDSLFETRNDKINRDTELKTKIWEFYNKSKDDLASSQTLYANQQYPKAIHTLTRSVEKLAKAFQLYMGISTVDKLQGHFPIQRMRAVAKYSVLPVFDIAMDPEKSSILDVFDSIIPGQPFLDLVGDQRTITRRFIEWSGELQSPDKIKEMVLLPKEDIDKLINYIDKLEINKSTVEKSLDQFLKSDELKELVSRLKVALIKFVNVQKEKDASINVDAVIAEINKIDDKTIAPAIEKLFMFLMEVIYPYVSLHILAAFVNSHEKTSEYPDNKIGIDPMQTYTAELGIVQAYPSVSKVIARNLELLGKIFPK